MTETVPMDPVTDTLDTLRAELEGNVTHLTAKKAIATLRRTLSDKDCAQFIQTTGLWSEATSSWTGLPKKATSPRMLKACIYDIMLAVYRHFNYIPASSTGSESTTPRHHDHRSDTRVTRSKSKAVKSTLNSKTKVSSVIPERGLLILPNRRRPLEELKIQPDGIVTGHSAHFKPSSNNDSWDRVVASFDVKTERERKEEEVNRTLQLSFFKLAYYARETLSTQKTRQFVYNMIITETHIGISRFDRCGVVKWPWLNYADDPTILVRALLMIGNHDLKTIGVDPTVTFNADNVRQFSMICRGKPVVYTEVSTTFASSELCDRATMCWVVKDASGAGRRYLLKQQFADVKRLSEWMYLKNVHVSGVVKMHFEQRYERVSKSRGERPPFPDTFYDRVMVRGIFDVYGDPIDEVKSRKGVLLALHDVIAGHRDLWLQHNVLHRDVSFGNILYAKENTTSTSTVNGASSTTQPHGVLIDFDMSSWYDPTKPRQLYEVSDQTGTTSFQSMNSQKSDMWDNNTEALWKPLHDHVEELESFFWVLYWITNLHIPPDAIDIPEVPQASGSTYDSFSAKKGILEEFCNTDSGISVIHKAKILDPSHPPGSYTNPGWGKAYNDLIRLWARVCRIESERKVKESFVGGRTQPVTMEESRLQAPDLYERVMRLIQNAIRELDVEVRMSSGRAGKAKPLRQVHQVQVAVPPPRGSGSVSDMSGAAATKRTRELEDETPTDPLTEPDDSPRSKKSKV